MVKIGKTGFGGKIFSNSSAPPTDEELWSVIKKSDIPEICPDCEETFTPSAGKREKNQGAKEPTRAEIVLANIFGSRVRKKYRKRARGGELQGGVIPANLLP